MKRFIRILVVILAILLSFNFVACDDNTLSTDNTAAADASAFQNEIADVTPTYTSISAVTASLAASLTDEQKNTALPSEYSSGVYSITESGDYYFSGTLTGAITVAKNSGNVHIYLDNVTLSVAEKNAISSKAGSNLIITLIGTNNLSNSLVNEENDKHVINSKENLVINGSGTLTIDSTKSAIACDKTFIGLGGTINVTAVKHAVTADSIFIDGLTINAVS